LSPSVTASPAAERKNRTAGLANDVLRCRTKEHEIGCSSTLYPHDDQFGLTIRGDPQDSYHRAVAMA
jgi:hypothetical protein